MAGSPLMTSSNDLVRSSARAFKLAAAVVGAVTVLVSIGYMTNEYAYLGSAGKPSFSDMITIVAILGITLSGIALLASIPNSLRVRFQRPRKITREKPTYGFTTMLAVGLGATLGSPLFILIPLNVVQFEFVSLGSLLLATVLSILMARVYSNMYTDSERLGLDAMGGPSFTKAATGTHSVRYFISRLSMWIANTALAAYSKIVFVVFDFELMPAILSNFGINGLLSELIIWLIAGVFIGWTILNVLFEQRMLRLIGYLQIALTSIMVVILAYQSLALGAKGSWNLSGIFHFTGGGNWVEALVINTGYLYLLFFGFQEIQALEHDAIEYSSIPIVSWIKRGYKISKSRYLGIAMVLSVSIAAAINILYGLAVFSLHPQYQVLLTSQIPALYLANTFLGPGQELLTAIAFLIATITTFVPSFLAASRQLGALGDDGFLPQSLSRLSYVFTLVAILILALGDQNFLISITDFLVLISLGLISLSQIWLENRGVFSMKRNDALPLVVGISCFVAGVTQYFISSSVAIFGSVAIAVAYLIYDVYELGSLGSQLFLGIFDGVVYSLLALYPHTFSSQAFFLFEWLHIPAGDTNILSTFLLVSLVLLFVNLTIDIYLRRAKSRSFLESRDKQFMKPGVD